MKVIKGKKEYTLSVGDYLSFNGAVWCFVPKNNEELPMDTWFKIKHLPISKKEAERIIREYPTQKIEKNGMIYYLLTPKE